MNKKEKDDGVNRETVMKELALLLDDVLIHPAVAGEIKQLILGTGNEIKFIKQLTKQVGLLKEYGINVIQLPQFEKLKNYRGLYSMHLESNVYNIRMLYTYGKDGEIILHCFYEKEGKEVTGYEKHAPIAMERKREMEV